MAGSLTLLVVLAGWWFWPRPPAVEFDNLKYVQMLLTSLSAENAEWLAKVEAAVHTRHSNAEMSDAELAHFQEVIDIAKGGDWKGAYQSGYTFAEAQLGRRRTRAASEEHSHDHGHSH